MRHAFSAHRRLAALMGLVLIVALVGFGASVALAPGVSDSARIGTSLDPAAITASRADALWLDSQVKALKSSRAAVAPLLLTLDPAAITASRAETQWLDSQSKALKSSRGTVVPVSQTVDPAAIAASKADAEWLDSQVKALKSSRGTVAPPTAPTLPDGSRYEGKPLPK
jgi:hypothetical protein